MANTSPLIKDLSNFIDRLVAEKGLENLAEEVLSQLKSDLADRLEDRINALLIEKMPPAKVEDFEKLLDEGSEEEIKEFCQKNIPDLDQAIAAELLSFRGTYLG